MPRYNASPAALLDEEKRLKIMAEFAEKPPQTLLQYAVWFENVRRLSSFPHGEKNIDYEAERIDLAWANYYNAMHCVCWNAHYFPEEE